jgi:hypothetical protein
MEGIKVKILKPNEILYRANSSKSEYFSTKAEPGNLASINYDEAPVKYFTLSEKGTESYSNNGVSVLKAWELKNENPENKIKLIDILDLSTREKLEELFTTNEEKKTFKKAFPIVNGRVSRNSKSTKKDNIVLNKLCTLNDYDGYYMSGFDINPEAKHSFHSEVGLCGRALSKLKLKSKKIIKKPEKTKKISRAEYEERQKLYLNNNKNNNNRNNMNTTRKKRFRPNNKPIAKQLF